MASALYTFLFFLVASRVSAQVDTVLRLSFGMHVGVGIDRGCELWNGDRKMEKKQRMVFDNILQTFCRADVG